MQTVSTATASTYGTAVVAKVVLLATALALASYTTLVRQPRLADTVLGSRVGWRPQARRLATTVTAEVAVLATAVAVAALMTTVPTAREVSRAGTLSAPVSATVDGLFVTFEAVPTGSGQHLVVRTEPVVRPVARRGHGRRGRGRAAARREPLRAVHAGLRETEAGRYEGTVAEPGGGDWSARLVLQRDGRPDSVLDVPWSPGIEGRRHRRWSARRRRWPCCCWLAWRRWSAVAVRRRRGAEATETDAAAGPPSRRLVRGSGRGSCPVGSDGDGPWSRGWAAAGHDRHPCAAGAPDVHRGDVSSVPARASVRPCPPRRRWCPAAVSGTRPDLTGRGDPARRARPGGRPRALAGRNG